MTIEDLKAQLAATEAEFADAQAHVARCDGAMQLLRHLLAKELKALDTPVVDSK